MTIANIILLFLLGVVVIAVTLLIGFLEALDCENRRLNKLFNIDYKFDYENNTLTNLKTNEIVSDFIFFNSIIKRTSNKFINLHCDQINNLKDLKNHLIKRVRPNIFVKKENETEKHIEYFLNKENLYLKEIHFNKQDLSIKEIFIDNKNENYYRIRELNVNPFYEELKKISNNKDYKNIKDEEHEIVYISTY